MNIVSLITCKPTGLSYVGVTKNGRLDDPTNFSPLRYGFGPRFVEALKRFGPDAFTVQILGHGYETRAELCGAQREFIEHHHTLWPHGYNVLEGRESRVEFDAEWSEAVGLRVSQNPAWRAANAAAANQRKQTEGWRKALKRRSKNLVWRRNISAARPPYLHRRWHIERGMVPDGTTVEDCPFCEAVALRKLQRLLQREKLVTFNVPTAATVENKPVTSGTAARKMPRREQNPPRIPLWRKLHKKLESSERRDVLENATSLEQDIKDIARRVNEMFRSRS